LSKDVVSYIDQTRCGQLHRSNSVIMSMSWNMFGDRSYIWISLAGWTYRFVWSPLCRTNRLSSTWSIHLTNASMVVLHSPHCYIPDFDPRYNFKYL